MTTISLPSFSTASTVVGHSARQAHLAEHGWLAIRGLIPNTELDPVRVAFATEVDRLSREWQDQGMVKDARLDLSWSERYEVLRREIPPSHSFSWRKCIASEGVFRMWQQPALVDIMRDLIGTELWASSTWNGRPRSSGHERETIGWHQDAHYMTAYRPGLDRMLTVWMPLVPVDADSGCLAVCPGSHRGGVRPIIKFPDNGLVGVAESEVDAYTQVDVPMQPGDVLIFDELMFHRSRGNRSGRTRWSLDIRFCDATNHVRTATEMGDVAEWSGHRHGVGYRCASADPAAIGSFHDWMAGYQYSGEF